MDVSKKVIREIVRGNRVCVVGPRKGYWREEIARDIKRFFKSRVRIVL